MKRLSSAVPSVMLISIALGPAVFRGGLVFIAHRLRVSLNSRLESNNEEEEDPLSSEAGTT